MRQDTQLEWEIREVEEDEWAEVVMTASPETRREARAAQLLAALSALALTLILAGVAGYRLWQEAEAGIVATERHIGTLVEVETIRQQKRAATGEIAADVRSVVVKGSAAMVRVVVTETSSLGHILPHIETRFYERCPAGWRRTEPVAAFWGDAATLDTPTLHFEFYELDRPFVEAVAGPVDTHHAALRQILGLPPLAATGRITVAVVPEYVAPGTLLPNGTLVEPSPYLYFAAPPGRDKPLLYGEAGATLFLRVQRQLLARGMEESRATYDVRDEWKPVVGLLEQWLHDHAEELPAIVKGDEAWSRKRIPTYPTALFTGIVTDDIGDYSPGYQEYRSQSIAFAAHIFLDFLVAGRGPGAISALLAAFGTQDNWPDVIKEAFGLSMAELYVAWDEYIQREPAEQDESTVRSASVR